MKTDQKGYWIDPRAWDRGENDSLYAQRATALSGEDQSTATVTGEDVLSTRTNEAMSALDDGTPSPSKMVQNGLLSSV